MKYSVKSAGGAPLACLMFGSSAWACRPRDEYIGWNSVQRIAALRLTTNNSRFLIYPWIRVDCLASYILALVRRRLPGDWLAKYGHPVYLIETYVECEKFHATCYRADNWICVGRTTGRGRNDQNNEWALPEKYIYLMPLARRWRGHLLAEAEG